MGKAPLELKGKTFGPLKVFGRWGSQNGNGVWIYWCRWCGHVDKRQGGTLLRRSARCPKCKARVDQGPWRHLEPDADAVEAIMATSPLCVRVLPDITRPLTHYSIDELCRTVDAIDAELRLRADKARSKHD